MFSCSKSSLNDILYFLLVNQNIDAQLFMHVKNHHQHMNCLILVFLHFFSFKLFMCKCYLQKVTLQKFKSHFLKIPTMNERNYNKITSNQVKVHVKYHLIILLSL
jgi:hypothetical protein